MEKNLNTKTTKSINAEGKMNKGDGAAKVVKAEKASEVRKTVKSEKVVKAEKVSEVRKAAKAEKVVKKQAKVKRAVVTKKWTERNKTYRKRHLAIAMAALEARSKRLDAMTIRETCRRTKMTATTFYVHGPNVNAVLTECEDWLLEDFRRWMVGKKGRELIFTKLLGFIRTHKIYFKLALKGRDFYVLEQMFITLRPTLAGRQIYEEAMRFYEGTLMAIVANWVLVEHLANNKIESCVSKMLHVRVMHF